MDTERSEAVLSTDSPDDDEAKEAAFDALVPGFRNTNHNMNSLKIGFDEGWHARSRVSAIRPLLAANETMQSALRVIVDSLAPTMSFWGEDLPDPVAVGYARGTAIRALEEVAND